MSGLLGRLADLASRTLATARAPRPARPDDEPVADMLPDAPLEPVSLPADSHHASAAPPESPDRAPEPGDPAASMPGEADARPQRATDQARSAAREPVSAPRSTEDRPTGPTAEAKAPPAEKGRPEADSATAPRATFAADARPSVPPRAVALQQLDPLPAPEPGSAIDVVAGAAPMVSIARPGLLRDAEIRVVPATDAVRGAPVDRQPDGALPELQERWRELGARLRAMHPPTASGGRPEGAGNGEASTRPDAARPRAVPVARQPPAPGEPTPAQRRPELIIRHLEIRIVAATKETAPVAESRSPAPVAPAWQTAARRYLRL